MQLVKSWRAVMASCLLSCFLLACDKPKKDIINFAIATAPGSLHPTLASDAVSERINALLYRPLISFDASQMPIPGIIKWEAVSHSHYQLRINTELPFFSNGEEVKVSDVLATLNAVINNTASPHYSALAHIREMGLLEHQIIDIKLSRDDPRFIAKLNLGLAPATHLDNPDQLVRNPVGNGEFAFVNWREDGGVVIERRSDQQRINFQVIPDPTMRLLNMLRGETHLIQNDLPHEMYEFLNDVPDVSLSDTPGSTFSYLGFNLTDSITGDIRIRRAVAHAIDRKAIIKYLFKGHAEKANTVLVSRHWASNNQLQDYHYQPEEARRLMHSLGYTKKSPLPLSYKTSTDPFRLRIASVLQAQLAEVGIALTINSFEWGTFFADIKSGNFQLYGLSWVGVKSADIFRYIYHSDSFPPKGANRGRYRSGKVDHLIDKAEVSEFSEAKKYYQIAQQEIHKDLVYVPLWYENNLLLNRGVTNACPQMDGGFAFLNQVILKHE